MTLVPSTGTPSTRDMAWIPGGTFRMGSDEHYPEERPVHEVTVDGFWMDEHPVTVAEFRRFVEATGYVTVAERPLDPADYPDADPELLVPGSLVFRRTPRPGRPATTTATGGTTCRAPAGAIPRGPAATLDGTRATTPSSTSPTRTPRPTPRGPARRCRPRPSGSSPRAAGWTAPSTPGATSSRPSGRMMANTWQGEFPWQNLRTDGYEGTSPVGRSRPTATACTTWPATSGSGPPTSIDRRIPRRRSTPAAASPQSTRACPRPRRSFDVGQPGRPDPAQGHQGRLAPVRAQLLPALPAGRAAAADDRDLDGPHRLPLHRARTGRDGVAQPGGSSRATIPTWLTGGSAGGGSHSRACSAWWSSSARRAPPAAVPGPAGRSDRLSRRRPSAPGSSPAPVASAAASTAPVASGAP